MKSNNTKFSPKTYIQSVLYDKVEVKRGKKRKTQVQFVTGQKRVVL